MAKTQKERARERRGEREWGVERERQATPTYPVSNKSPLHPPPDRTLRVVINKAELLMMRTANIIMTHFKVFCLQRCPIHFMLIEVYINFALIWLSISIFKIHSKH